jgi:hypothetical protein
MENDPWNPVRKGSCAASENGGQDPQGGPEKRPDQISHLERLAFDCCIDR